MAEIDPKKEMKHAERMLHSATDGPGKRLAVRLWLQGAIFKAKEDNHSTAAALELVKAFEMLESGRTHEIFRRPEGLKPGGKSKPIAEIATQGFALAAANALHATGLKKAQALRFIEGCLNIKNETLTDLEKKMNRERAKPERDRSSYLALVLAFDDETKHFKTLLMGDDPQRRVLFEIGQYCQALGLNDDATRLGE